MERAVRAGRETQIQSSRQSIQRLQGVLSVDQAALAHDRMVVARRMADYAIAAKEVGLPGS